MNVSIASKALIATELQGTPVSAGSRTGRARVVTSSEDCAGLQRHEILVCSAPTHELVPYLRMAAGIITEGGGALSNSATIMRELGIPAVSGVERAATRIREGQVVTIDGSTGVVSLQS